MADFFLHKKDVDVERNWNFVLEHPIGRVNAGSFCRRFFLHKEKSAGEGIYAEGLCPSISPEKNLPKVKSVLLPTIFAHAQKEILTKAK